MSKPTDIERVSQNRVVKLFKEELTLVKTFIEGTIIELSITTS